MNNELLLTTAINFIHSVGLETTFCSLNETDCFLPGIFIYKGKILIDKEKLKYPGDLIHEAAHLAVIPSGERNIVSGTDIGKRADAAAEEMMAIAWSYAPANILQLIRLLYFTNMATKEEAKILLKTSITGAILVCRYYSGWA
jgi:hypothetical protein